jgi:hypothetical protein
VTGFMTYEEALDELRVCSHHLDHYKPRFAFPRDKKPILAELQFGTETGNVTARLLDLDHGIWSYSLAKPNQHGVMNAIIAYWVSDKNLMASHLPFCPGCGAQSSNQHCHVEGYEAVRVKRDYLALNFRNRLQRLIESGI